MTYNAIAKQYEDDVLSGAIPAGKLLIAAINRQRKDLKAGHKREIWFDHEAGQNILDFAELVNIGPDTPIVLAPCQVWELYVFYGWKRNDGRRRFRYMYKSCARGNGKTPLESLKVLYHLVIDGPYKAQVYVSATKEDQAKIAFNDAKNMLEFSPDLAEALGTSAKSVFNTENKAKFGFLTSNPKTADGTRPTFAIIDEYHEFDNDDMIGKLETGLIKTPNPILDIVTTRGTDKSKPCYQAELKFYIPIVQGVIQNDAIFVLIFSLDPEDIEHKDKDAKQVPPWHNPATWHKANPMLEHLLRLDDMEEALKKATQKGAVALSTFKTLNLNMWVDAAEAWIEDDLYQRSGQTVDIKAFRNRGGYGGLDLAKRDDFCSFCLTFHRKEEDKDYFDSFWWHWIPQETIKRRIEDGLVSLPEWMEAGYIIATPGTVTDYDIVERDIKAIHDLYNILGCSYDQHNIGNLATNLTNYGIAMNIMPQTMMVLSEPTKQLTYAIREGRYNHGFDPVMRWQATNVVIITDSKENIMITKDKKRAREKVDGWVAAVIAYGEYLTQTMSDDGPSQYETQTIFSF